MCSTVVGSEGCAGGTGKLTARDRIAEGGDGIRGGRRGVCVRKKQRGRLVFIQAFRCDEAIVGLVMFRFSDVSVDLPSRRHLKDEIKIKIQG